MNESIQFWFHYMGSWIYDDGVVVYKDGDVDIVIDEVNMMTYDRVVKKYLELGCGTVKNIFVQEPGIPLKVGLFEVLNEYSFRSVLNYIKGRRWNEIEVFVDPNNDMPSQFTPNSLPVERSPLTWGMYDVGERMNNDPETVQSIYVSPAGFVSDEEDDDNDTDDDVGSENSEGNTQQECLKYDTDGGQHCFMLGMTFANAKEARDAINEYGVMFGYKLKFEKNETTRLRVYCLNETGCPFQLYISKDGNKGGLVVKTAMMEHKCFRQFSVPSASQDFLARYFKNQIYENPKFSVKDMQSEVKKHLKMHVSPYKCKRAKQIITHELNGSFKKEFGYLEAYAEALKRFNPGTKAEIQLCEEGLKNGKRIFKRMFVMLDACKKNWLGGCRPIIGLDGCFLKGVCQGLLLTAVGRDGNDQVVPIAWGVVSKENKVNWRWFLCWLTQELKLGDGFHLTIMSDMQKGLIDAVALILPKAEHRWCARHIYANWSKKWRGDELKKKFWICAWSTFEEELKTNLIKLGEVHKKAAEDLLRYPIQTWCRAYQSNRCDSYMVDNNMSESFNSCLVEARHKPIVSMLEEIRENTMERIRDKKNLCNAWFNEWSPAAMKMLDDNKNAAVGCKVLFNGDSGYEIGEGEDKHTVLLDKMACTCRKWELTGIPCMHAICAIYYSKLEPLSFMSKWYHKSTYLKAYQYPVLPVPSTKFMEIDKFAPIEPPPFEKMPGRRRKKRIRACNEQASSGSKLPRKGQIQECSCCKSSGHNKVRCPNKGNLKTPTSSTTTTTTTRPKQIQCRRQWKTSKQTTVVGVGCYVDLNSGRTTINPGLSSEKIITEGDQPIPQSSDPIVRFPIPNEREINRNKAIHNCGPSTFRTISFNGEGSQVRMPNELPFKPPGLQWNGGPSVTTRQLLEQRQNRKMGRISNGDTSGAPFN